MERGKEREGRVKERGREGEREREKEREKDIVTPIKSWKLKKGKVLEEKC